MENLKIRVNNKAESKEVQELFFELGYEKGACSTGDYPALIIATPESRFQKTPYSSRATSLNHEAHSQYKEITLAELRDLVVLKRNDVGDATHTDGYYSFYVGKDKNYFFSSCDKAWCGTWKNVEILKPIEKKEMKEYLDPENNYRFNVTDKPFFDWIEIPEGAEILIGLNKRIIGFYKNDFGLTWIDGKGWIETKNEYSDWIKYPVLWQRTTHPEELPFIDDDFKLNIPEELKGRAYSLSERIIIDDEPLKVIDSEYSKDGNSVTHTVSLNDQYAEIEKVRHNHYFKDVSDVNRIDVYEVLKRFNVTATAHY